jgi:hypothetical protein
VPYVPLFPFTLSLIQSDYNTKHSLLLLLSFASFLAQPQLLWVRGDSSGISLYYVLFNLIVASELFTVSFFHVVNNRVERSQFFVHQPPTVGDRLNLAQFAVVWVLWLLLYVGTFPDTMKPTTTHLTVSANRLPYQLHHKPRLSCRPWP